LVFISFSDRIVKFVMLALEFHKGVQQGPVSPCNPSQMVAQVELETQQSRTKKARFLNRA